MANLSPRGTMDRIVAAPARSPIAVFTSEDKGQLRSVFADTIMSLREIAAGKDRHGGTLVGVYDQRLNKERRAKVFARLQEAAA